MPNDTALLSVRMPARLVAELRELASKENNGVSPLVRRVLTQVVAVERRAAGERGE